MKMFLHQMMSGLNYEYKRNDYLKMSIERYITNSNNIETHWRSLILFGSNTACYKFALGETLLQKRLNLMN